MLLGNEQLVWSMRIATVVLPVAVYFFILGLLNSRKTPQLLTGRRDFVLMIAALSPLLLLPLVEALRPWPLAAALALAGAVGAVALLAPRGQNWVVYNLPADQARQIIARSLEQLGVDYQRQGASFRLDGSARLRVSGFPMLRNVSLYLEGGRDDLGKRLEDQLTRTLATVPAETTPMGVSLLLVATAMLVAPLAMVAHRVPEIVRILADLLQ
ncbi:MAG: hypothetical protein BWX88_02731 [Planctomycetes bacterium ADurb.Bin126]|nr:MAG: hypothetical protein BWX88_02731 [Planctomycetes bacterium ADurb.Bin126]HOD81414.1 hypothetical protein [Phycisphaerae bacterium]HQL73827.1 hypothetical protein [Phycisphaerae bacterium]